MVTCVGRCTGTYVGDGEGGSGVGTMMGEEGLIVRDGGRVGATDATGLPPPPMINVGATVGIGCETGGRTTVGLNEGGTVGVLVEKVGKGLGPGDGDEEGTFVARVGAAVCGIGVGMRDGMPVDVDVGNDVGAALGTAVGVDGECVGIWDGDPEGICLRSGLEDVRGIGKDSSAKLIGV